MDSHTGNSGSPDYNDDQNDWARSEGVGIQTACLFRKERIPVIPGFCPGENELSTLDRHGSDFGTLSIEL